MAIVVTRNVETRYRGFLTSLMLEVTADVYIEPDMSPSVRNRIWNVLSDWWMTLGNGSIVLVWRDKSAVSSLRIEILGDSPKEIVDADGVLRVKRS